jgi:broad specificity phosphatase PhoE
VAEQQDERRAFEVGGDTRIPVGPGNGREVSAFDPTRLDFGHYAGKTIEELAEEDPDYLLWLERHASGVRYRAEIQRVLGVVRRSLEWRQ